MVDADEYGSSDADDVDARAGYSAYFGDGKGVGRIVAGDDGGCGWKGERTRRGG